jgi:RHS repeat-associated protein
MYHGRRKEENGLYFFRARYLDTALGRFLQKDPIGDFGDGMNVGNGQSFCGNNPVNVRDPFGLLGDWLGEIAEFAGSRGPAARCARNVFRQHGGKIYGTAPVAIHMAAARYGFSALSRSMMRSTWVAFSFIAVGGFGIYKAYDLDNKWNQHRTLRNELDRQLGIENQLQIELNQVRNERKPWMVQFSNNIGRTPTLGEIVAYESAGQGDAGFEAALLFAAKNKKEQSPRSDGKHTGLEWQEGWLNVQGKTNPNMDNNEDWRGENEDKSPVEILQDAVATAMGRTGLNSDEFEVTCWGKDKDGKSFPVEWEGPNGTQVNVDWPHHGRKRDGTWATGPDAPHVGWKHGVSNKRVGHILLDDVPYNR